jgi:hypothetical protein
MPGAGLDGGAISLPGGATRGPGWKPAYARRHRAPFARTDSQHGASRVSLRTTPLGALLLAGSAGSAGAASDPPPAIAGTAAEIRLDGVLDEPAWTHAMPIGPLVQRDPTEGAPASEATEARVLKDGDTLYLGIECHDRSRHPRGLVPSLPGRANSATKRAWVVDFAFRYGGFYDGRLHQLQPTLRRARGRGPRDGTGRGVPFPGATS